MTARGKKIMMPPFLSKLHETMSAQLEQIEQEEESVLYKAEKSIHVTNAVKSSTIHSVFFWLQWKLVLFL